MPDVPPIPMSFVPYLRPQVWGGRHLETLGRNLPPNQPVGESWELSTHPMHISLVATPATLAGQGFDQLWRSALASRDAAEQAADFPLLIKLLDARDWTSIQLHPDDLQARQNAEGSPGKTEAWYILHTEPDAELLLGTRPGVTAEDLAALTANAAGSPPALNETLGRLFVHNRPSVGDFILIRPGVVHSCKGITAWEIQTPSDLTYRLFDWNRLGPDGRPRELHVAKALASVRQAAPKAVVTHWPGVLREQEQTPRFFRYLDAPFQVEHWTVGTRPFRLPPGPMRVLCTIRGELRLRGNGFEEEVPGIQLRLLPAGIEECWVSARTGEAELLLVMPASEPDAD